jgi:hypothetical protein
MKSIIKILISLMTLLLVMTGCEYDAPTAMWKQPQPDYPTATITQITPEIAVAGENYINIIGENFAPVLEDNQVFFDNVRVDLVEGSTTSLTVRRPNRSGDAITVKVVSYGTLLVAQKSPYKIDPVIGPYGNILSGNSPLALAVDDEDNAYVMFRTSGVTTSLVQKFTPGGDRIDIGNVPVFSGDAVFAPNGKLTYFRNNNKIIRQLDVTTGVSDTLITMSKNISYGDFDENGNLYTGGKKSDLFTVTPDLTEKASGFYSKDEIFYIRVFNGYVYLLAAIAAPDASTPALGIFRHTIDASGSVGARELIFDWASAGEDYAASVPSSFTISAAGILYVASDNTNPLLKYNLETHALDIMYKDIVSASVIALDWGGADYLYYIKGATDTDATETLMRIDMGEAGIH